jgi:hypothetical protein
MVNGRGARSTAQAGLVAAVGELPRLMDVPGRVVGVMFRGRPCTLLAQRVAPAYAAGSDAVEALEAAGAAAGSGHGLPVQVHAAIEAGRDPVRVLARASRWASYAARVAVVPQERVSDVVLLEASLRGIWVVGAGVGQRPQVCSVGELGPTPGSVSGPHHRALYDLVAAVLDFQGPVGGASDLLPVPLRRRGGQHDRPETDLLVGGDALRAPPRP